MSWLGLDLLLDTDRVQLNSFVSSNSLEHADYRWNNDGNEQATIVSVGVDDAESQRSMSTISTYQGDTSVVGTTEDYTAVATRSTVESEEITIHDQIMNIQEHERNVVDQSHLPFALFPPTYAVGNTLMRNYVNDNFGTNEPLQNFSHQSGIENNSEGLTIVPSVRTVQVSLTPDQFNHNVSKRLAATNMAVTHENVTSASASNGNTMFGCSTLLAKNDDRTGLGTVINKGNATESPSRCMSSLSLQPSSVDSSFISEWASLNLSEGMMSVGSPQLSTPQDEEGIEIVPSIGTFTSPQVVNEIGLNLDVENDTHYDDVRSPLSQSIEFEKSIADDDTGSSELESLTNSFVREETITQEKQNNFFFIKNRSNSLNIIEPWFTGLETDEDWDEFRNNVAVILSCTSPDIHSENAASNGFATSVISSTSSSSTIDKEFFLARLIQEEEEFWTTKNKRAEIQSNEVATTCVRTKTMWKVFEDVAVALTAAAVLSVSYKILQGKK